MLKHASLEKSKSSSQYYDSVASWKPRQRPYDPKAGVPSLMVMPQLVQICSSYKGGDWGPMVSLAIGPLTLSLLWLKSNTGTQITSHGGAALCYSSVQCQRAAILLCQNKRLCLCLSLCNCQCLYVVCKTTRQSPEPCEKKGIHHPPVKPCKLHPTNRGCIFCKDKGNCSSKWKALNFINL